MNAAMNTEMGHPDEALIHDFVDEELPTEEHARIEAHVAACRSCHALAGSIRALGEEARGVLAGAPAIDAADQWGAIEASIQLRRRGRGFAWLSPVSSPLSRAAVVALLVASGAALYAVVGRPSADAPTPATVAAARTEQSPAASIAVAYAPTLGELERILAAERDRLQPETIATLEANLAILDGAIRDIEAALAADPAHRGNLRSLDTMYQTKLGVLQQLVTLSRGA